MTDSPFPRVWNAERLFDYEPAAFDRASAVKTPYPIENFEFSSPGIYVDPRGTYGFYRVRVSHPIESYQDKANFIFIECHLADVTINGSSWVKFQNCVVTKASIGRIPGTLIIDACDIETLTFGQHIAVTKEFLNILDNNTVQILRFHGASFNHSVKISGYVKELHLMDVTLDQDFYYISHAIAPCRIQFTVVKINASCTIDHLLNADLQVHRVWISEKGHLTLTGMEETRSLEMQGVFAKGRITLSGITFDGQGKEPAHFAIRDCEVSKLELQNSDFRKAIIDPYGTEFMNVWYTKVNFPEALKSYHSKNIGAVDYGALKQFSGLMEAFAKRVGDKAGAMQWHVLGLRALRRDIKGWNSDKLVLVLSEWISDYGQNWWQAVKALFWVSLFFHALLLSLVLFECPDLLQWHSMDVLLRAVSHFAEFLLPTRSVDYMGLGIERLHFFGTYRVIDITARIFQGFIIYQLIRSTRKFV